VVENAIFQIKRRLYQLLRGNLIKDWPKYLTTVVEQENSKPKKKLGYLKPENILSEFDSAQVQDAKMFFKIPTFSQPSFKQQQKNQTSYEKDPKEIQVGDYVYLTDKEPQFSKSYDTQVNANIASKSKISSQI
jgi:hypothetical protein